jgi:alanine-glyoxylate transaminase/(R)-3-amino-2-methylpropionate-pyruvate transaminase
VLQLNIVEGKRQYLYDEHGRRYLDAFAGIATVCCGHCHPDVVDAITAQAKRLQHSTVLYLNHAIADFAEALASKLPGDLKARVWRRVLCACSVLFCSFQSSSKQ